MKQNDLDDLIQEAGEAVALCFRGSNRGGVPLAKQEQFFSTGQRGNTSLVDITDRYEEFLAKNLPADAHVATLQALQQANQTGRWIRNISPPSQRKVSKTLDEFHLAFSELEGFLA